VLFWLPWLRKLGRGGRERGKVALEDESSSHGGRCQYDSSIIFWGLFHRKSFSQRATVINYTENQGYLKISSADGRFDVSY
jgi:hypothetical protein